jgi:hypothetical protein
MLCAVHRGATHHGKTSLRGRRTLLSEQRFTREHRTWIAPAAHQRGSCAAQRATLYARAPNVARACRAPARLTGCSASSALRARHRYVRPPAPRRRLRVAELAQGRHVQPFRPEPARAEHGDHLERRGPHVARRVRRARQRQRDHGSRERAPRRRRTLRPPRSSRGGSPPEAARPAGCAPRPRSRRAQHLLEPHGALG